MRIAAGRLHNHLVRAVVPATMNPGADSLRPATNLYDGRPSTVAAFGSIQADSNVSADLNIVRNSGFEVSPIIGSGWQMATGTGTFTANSTPLTPVAGGFYGTLNHTAATMAWQDVACVPGQMMKLGWNIHGSGGVAGAVRVYNPLTGRYLQLDGSWHTTAVDLDSHAADSWKAGSKIFAIEPSTVIGKDTTVLRVIVRTSASGSAHFDELIFYPGTDLIAVLGHNITPLLTPQFITFTLVPATTTVRATLIPRRRSFYALLAAPIFERYVRLGLAGTPDLEAPKIGELIFTQTRQLPRAPIFPVRFNGKYQQVRNETPGAEQWRVRLATDETREVPMTFRWKTEAEHQELRDYLFRMSSGGFYPALLVPERGDPSQAYWGDEAGDLLYGWLEEEVGVTCETRTEGGEIVRTTEVRLAEAPFPR